MAQYHHLPIYKQTYDILLRTMTATTDFPREHQNTPGQKIKGQRRARLARRPQGKAFVSSLSKQSVALFSYRFFI